MRRPLTLILLSVTTLFLLILLFSSFTFSAVLAGSLEGETAVAPALASQSNPELEVEKWHAGNYAAPGSVVVYGIRYANTGDLAAENVVLTDTLPTYTTYADDTSGIVPTFGTGNVISWDIGTLDPGEEHTFALTLDVFGVVQDNIISENCAGITTTTPGDSDPGNNQNCADAVDVIEDDVQLRIEKWPNPNDPTPGEEFSYFVDWCNQRGAAVGPVLLTDTLPAELTLLAWYPGDRENFWRQESFSPQELVLYAPGLPGDWCETLELRVEVDSLAEISTTLQNIATIYADGDVEPGDDTIVDNSAHISPPRHDLSIEKQVHEFVPVSNGWINYVIYYRNDGNVPVDVTITETIPTGFSFNYAHWGGNQPQQFDPFPDPDIQGNQLIWDLGTAPVGYAAWFHIIMDIGSVTPGVEIENCIAIDSGGVDSSPGNNTSCFPVTINDNGPNLQISKYHWWNGDSQIEYRAEFANIGDVTINDVWLTDTLPLNTSWAGWWHTEDFNFEQERLDEMDQVDREITWHFDHLNPGERGTLAFAADLDSLGSLQWFTNTIEIDTPASDVSPEDNSYDDVAFSGGEVEWVGIDVYRAPIWGYAPVGDIVIDTIHEQHTFENGGDFYWDANNPFLPGDMVTITADAGSHPVIITIPDPFTAQANSQTDEVWGQIDHLDHEWIEVDIYDGPFMGTQTDDIGNFSVTFPDIPRGGEGDVRYQTEIDYADVTFFHHFRTQDLILESHYGHDWVQGNYEVGHTVWITVTDNGGAVKGLAELTTQAFPNWNGDSGFSTVEEGWLTSQPDIQPGDWIYGRIDNGQTTEVRVGTISGNVDSDDDSIQGTIAAQWLDANTPVPVDCQTWGAPDPQNKQTEVLPDGSDVYECGWNWETEWDVQPGQDISVFYDDPSLNKIGNIFRDPAPYLQAEKWSYGTPAEGGNLIFNMAYMNYGDAAAADVTLTDIMTGMTYLTDTSGLPVSGSGTAGDPLNWDVGALAADEYVEFDLFVQVTEVASNTITNSLQIDSSSIQEQGSPNNAMWEGHVEDNDTHLNIDKWAWTGDPAPDTNFIFTVNVCNNGSTDSNMVTVTDTLHTDLTLQSWWPQDPGWWEVSSSDHELVIARHAIAAGHCSQIYLEAHVDAFAEPGDFIDNTAVLSSSSDLEIDDNEAHWEGWINWPHTNIGVHKYWNWGQLVPGGQIGYGIHLYNNGNLPVDGTILLTDTLPAHTSFDSAWQIDEPGSPPWVPVEITDDYVVWEIDGLQNGFNHDWEVILNIDNDATPGDELENIASVTPQPDEDDYDDNESTWTETLNPFGPNVRVRKNGEWDGHDPNSRHANYWISIENIGDVRVDDVTINDTYPVEMVIDDWYDTEWWRLTDYQHDAGNHQFTAVYEYLYPGEITWFNFGAGIPGDGPLPPDQTYVNSVEVTAVPDEIDTTDNVDTAELHSCMTPPEVTDLTLYIDGDDVVFDWSDVGAENYEIWWSDIDPYVEAGPNCDPEFDCQHTDNNNHHRLVGAASDTQANGYYRLIARNYCGTENAADYTVAMFRFEIQPGD